MAREEYNWLDDPFDEKKNAQMQEQGMGAGSRIAIMLGCLGIAIVMVMIVVGLIGSLSVLASSSVL